ncbi:MAG: ATP-binding cassette domain-containing protein [Planctomycetes bacterium]|nr:ATP-binding cassette domain-containing protein [Planctomycetota bacterium]
MIAVALEGLVVELGGRAVLGPLDLSIEERTWTLLVGPSGAGKTTLLRAVAGLVAPARGRVLLAGVVASSGRQLSIRPEERGVGFVFQGGGAGLWPHMNARRTLEFVLAARKVPRAARARRVTELLELVELTGLDARRPGELSGGEAQRLALARALAHDPRVLLLDEPLGPLDARLRQDLARRIHEVHARRGLTTLHVTHDPDEARGHADRIVRLEAGRVAADGAA